MYLLKYFLYSILFPFSFQFPYDIIYLVLSLAVLRRDIFNLDMLGQVSIGYDPVRFALLRCDLLGHAKPFYAYIGAEEIPSLFFFAEI